ncbi:hypothetical protein [Natronococcus jeotgali]|nr:hypothetical protein [Natronococcus jeotgali]
MSQHKQSERSDGSEDMIERLGDIRRSALKGLRAVGGEGNTTEIRQAVETETGTKIPVGSTQYHFRWLESEGLIVEVDREEVNHGGQNAIVWGLTEDGQQLLEEIDALEDRGDRPQTLEGLNDRIDELEQEVEDLRENIRLTFENDLPAVVEELVENELQDREEGMS